MIRKCKKCGQSFEASKQRCPYCNTLHFSKAHVLIVFFIMVVILIFVDNYMGSKDTIQDQSIQSEPGPPVNSQIKISGIPEYTITTQEGTFIAILMSPGVDPDQLKALIYAFSNARAEKRLSKMIPATTLNLKTGNYLILTVFIFDDPDWAVPEKLKEYTNAKLKYPSDQTFAHEYVKHIKGVYSYTPGVGEYGNLGYSDGVKKTSNYHKLF